MDSQDVRTRIIFEFKQDKLHGDSLSGFWFWLAKLVEASISHSRWRIVRCESMIIIDGDVNNNSRFLLPEYENESS